jgi:orotidine-5'-phosphate decarboxylase
VTASPVFCALDTTEPATAAGLAATLGDSVGGLKLGLEFFVACGPAGVRRVMADADAPLFLDLKLHDIPNTVAGAVRAAAPLGAAFITVHTQGGLAMMRAAQEAAQEAAEAAGTTPPCLLGVTVLTSLDDADLDSIGVAGTASDQVRRLALLAREAGLGGIVCSPHEIAVLRGDLGPETQLVVPGIRPGWSTTDDQKRVMTPAEAMRRGADRLVIGRPITAAADPAAAARAIAEEIAAERGR